jgi:hypothetical protein
LERSNYDHQKRAWITRFLSTVLMWMMNASMHDSISLDFHIQWTAGQYVKTNCEVFFSTRASRRRDWTTIYYSFLHFSTASYTTRTASPYKCFFWTQLNVQCAVWVQGLQLFVRVFKR